MSQDMNITDNLPNPHNLSEEELQHIMDRMLEATKDSLTRASEAAQRSSEEDNEGSK